MPETVRPILLTPDIERLRASSLALLDATVEERLPEDGPAFYLEPWVGDSTVGLTADADVVAGTPGRILLSIGVPDVDALLPRAEGLGGHSPGPSKDMPRGSGSRTSPTRTATRCTSPSSCDRIRRFQPQLAGSRCRGHPLRGGRMTEQRPDTTESHEPGGTPSPGPDNLIDKPVTPGDDGRATAVPGVYEADEAEQERGKAVKPGN